MRGEEVRVANGVARRPERADTLDEHLVDSRSTSDGESQQLVVGRRGHNLRGAIGKWRDV